jgi:hypothetical protein
MSLNELTALLEKLPPELQQEVFDFASYLAEKKAGRQPAAVPQRVAGLHAGQVTMRDDFGEPLSDDFWLGQER